MPPDASDTAQARAHICLLDAMGIPRAAVLGASAGAPSALQLTILHPGRVSALVLLVPMAYKPPALANSAVAIPVWLEATMMRLIGSDFLFWVAIHAAPSQVVGLVLATPPELLLAASPQERSRVDAMLASILPVSARAQGLLKDTAASKHLTPSALESIAVPTLIVSARDDRYGTYASAQYTASQIQGSKFVGYVQGGHAFVGHNDEVMTEVVQLLGAIRN
jgi:2-hydroxy-6-oxonona-2,4-dienedioate hydrolase